MRRYYAEIVGEICRNIWTYCMYMCGSTQKLCVNVWKRCGHVWTYVQICRSKGPVVDTGWNI